MTGEFAAAQDEATGRTLEEPQQVNGWRYIGAQGLGGMMPANFIDATGTVGVSVKPTARQVPLDGTDPDAVETASNIHGSSRIAEPTREQRGYMVIVGLVDTWTTIIQREVATAWADPALSQREAADKLAAEAVLAAVMFCRRQTPAAARALLQEQDKYDEYPDDPYECQATFPPCAVDPAAETGAPTGRQVTLAEAVGSQ